MKAKIRIVIGKKLICCTCSFLWPRCDEIFSYTIPEHSLGQSELVVQMLNHTLGGGGGGRGSEGHEDVGKM